MHQKDYSPLLHTFDAGYFPHFTTPGSKYSLDAGYFPQQIRLGLVLHREQLGLAGIRYRAALGDAKESLGRRHLPATVLGHGDASEPVNLPSQVDRLERPCGALRHEHAGGDRAARARD